MVPSHWVTDNGAHWNEGGAGLPVYHYMRSMATAGNDLFVGGRAGYVYVITDNGAHWKDVSEGAPPVEMEALLTDGSDLFGGTSTGGVVRRPLSQMVTSLDEPGGGTVPTRYSLSQNYPNPFNPTTNIQLTIVIRKLMIVKVFDLLGREAATLVNEVKEPGTYTVQFDGSNLASGVYFYRLSVVPLARRDLVPTIGRDGQAGDFVQSKRLILLK